MSNNLVVKTTNLNTVLDSFMKQSVGLDRLLDEINFMTSNTKSITYPPYNIEKVNDEEYLLTIAVSGFTENDIEVETKDGRLIVKGRKPKTEEEKTYLYKGLAEREFERVYTLSEDIKVKSVSLRYGLLEIYLEHLIPEDKKSIKYKIGK